MIEGVEGRTDHLTKIRGVLFSPVSVEELLRGEFPDIGEFEIVVEKKGVMDDISLKFEVGKKADVVLLNDRATVPIFEINVANYIVGTCERVDVNTVVIDGQVVMKDGEFLLVDEEAVRAKTQTEAIKLWEVNGWPTP